MKPKSSSGIDGIPSKVIKEIAPEIAAPLTHIVNLSLLTGEIPTELKAASSNQSLKTVIKKRPQTIDPSVF